jgi:hypothetical protein
MTMQNNSDLLNGLNINWMISKMVQVLGLTSLCYGSDLSLKDSLHLFMCDFDDYSKYVVLKEGKRIHEDHGIDIYILQSSFAYGFHLVSFDVLDWKTVKHIQAWIRLNTDYPFINARYSVLRKGVRFIQKHFLTLRIGEKLLKGSPKYLTRFVSPNKHMKSITHYKIYQNFCNLPDAPDWYDKDWLYVDPLISVYTTFHNLGGLSAS